MTSSWMLVAGLLFAAMGLFVKLASAHFGAAEIAFYRSFITMVVAFAVIYWQRETVRTAFFQGHAIRGIVGGISLIGFFYAIAQLSLATALTSPPVFSNHLASGDAGRVRGYVPGSWRSSQACHSVIAFFPACWQPRGQLAGTPPPHRPAASLTMALREQDVSLYILLPWQVPR